MVTHLQYFARSAEQPKVWGMDHSVLSTMDERLALPWFCNEVPQKKKSKKKQQDMIHTTQKNIYFRTSKYIYINQKNS